MKRIRDYFNRFSAVKWVMFILMIILWIAFAEREGTRLYWKYFTPDIIKLHSLRVVNPNVIYHPGEFFCYKLSFDKLLPGSGTVTRQLYSTNKGFLPPIISEPIGKDVGLEQTITAPMYISKLADNDKYFMIWEVCYPVGPDKIPACYKTTSDELMVYDAPLQIGPKGDTGKQGIQGKKGDTGGVVIFGGKK
jgi:hypothetical protein